MRLPRSLQMKWTVQFSLRKRIAFTMILLLMVSTICLGTAVFQISRKTIERNYQTAHLHNLQVSSQMMDIYLQEIIEEGRTLLENDKFIDIMKNENKSSGYFSSRNQLSIDKALGDIAAHNSLINGMLVVNESGNWRYYAKSKVYSGYLNHYYTTDKLLDETWVQSARDALGREVFYPSDVLLEDRAKDCFCYVKNLINPSDQKSFGFLVVSIDKNIWRESFGKDTEGYVTNRYMVTLPEEMQQEMQGETRAVYLMVEKRRRRTSLMHITVETIQSISLVPMPTV